MTAALFRSRGPLRRSRAWLLALALGVGAPTLVVPSQAVAQNSQNEARERFTRGMELFREGDFQASIIEFKRAYEIAPNYNVLYNIGQVYFQMQDYVRAHATLTQYLEDGGRRIPPSRRAEVEKDLEKLKARIASVTVTTDVEGAQIAVDDVAVGTTPLAGPIAINAGRRTITASMEGRQTARKVLEVAGADALEISLELAELAPGQTADPRPVPGEGPGTGQPGPAPGGGARADTSSFPVVPVVAWGVTGALLAGTAVFGVLALSKDTDLADLKAQPNPSPDELASTASSASTLALVSDVFLITTIVGAGVATALTIHEFGGNEERGEAGARFAIGPGSVVLSGSF